MKLAERMEKKPSTEGRAGAVMIMAAIVLLLRDHRQNYLVTTIANQVL